MKAASNQAGKSHWCVAGKAGIPSQLAVFQTLAANVLFRGILLAKRASVCLPVPCNLGQIPPALCASAVLTHKMGVSAA